jgi:hypothetical protein
MTYSRQDEAGSSRRNWVPRVRRASVVEHEGSSLGLPALLIRRCSPKLPRFVRFAFRRHTMLAFNSVPAVSQGVLKYQYSRRDVLTSKFCLYRIKGNAEVSNRRRSAEALLPVTRSGLEADHLFCFVSDQSVRGTS